MERKLSTDEPRRRLKLALKPAEGPVIEEVLEHVSNHGVLRGPVDWVFKAWIAYVEYATRGIAEAFPLTEEERGQLLHFRDAVKRLLLEAQRQVKEKLASIYKAVVDGTYRMKGNRLYAPDGAWMYVREGFAPRIIIRGVTAKTRFPDILKLPRERLELLQLGWRASDEGNDGGRPYMGTTQPWQVFAWVATRYGALRAYVASVNLTREGASVEVVITARGWMQRWSKAEAVDLVASHLRRGEWTPLLTMWLGDGKAERSEVLSGEYKLVIAAKEPWRLGSSIGAEKALVARGKEAFRRLRESAGVYGVLLDLLRAHKWIEIKLATDDALRAAYKLKARKRGIDVLREAFGQNGEIPTEQFSHAEDGQRRGAVAVAGVVMSLRLVNGRGGSLLAERYVRDLGRALAVAGRLESAGLKPNVVRTNPGYTVYIATADLLRLAERDGEIRRAVALYLAEKAKNGTQRQRELAEKILQRHPFLFSQCLSVASTSLCVDRYRTETPSLADV
ncbi:hypothetical protein B7L68_02980 [Thermoproteus sp. CP80]|uniref:hypothetical protein n=1 Tax=Thermoproteus sp. CP80 TaxID=1650659 RepID=UPI0009BF9872|nr:hypothetical protein [Thermoproteus sp. CP80]PLC65737.1 hypothetical protein B7L68_02980 [Thermoproteus sp. CP80]